MTTTVNFLDGGLGLNAAASDKLLVIGPASGGTKETYVYTVAQPQSVNSQIGYGPAQQAAEGIIDRSGAQVDIIVANASIAGYTETVTSGSGTPVMTVAGTPNSTYEFIGSITSAGDLDAARIKYSLDGGRSYTESQYLKGDQTLENTNLTLTFATASYSVGQTWTFDAFAPQMNAADLVGAFETISGSINTPPKAVLIANDTQSAASGSALFAAVNSSLSSLAAKGIHTSAIMSLGGVDADYAVTKAEANTIEASTGNNIVVVPERAERIAVTRVPGNAQQILPQAFAFAEHVAAKKVSSPADYVGFGSLPGWLNARYDAFKQGDVYSDAAMPVMTSKSNKGGLYFLNSKAKVGPTSDWRFYENNAVATLAANVASQALDEYDGYQVEVLTDGSGHMTDAERLAIELDIQSRLDAALINVIDDFGKAKYCSAVIFTINPLANVLTTNQFDSSLLIIPKAKVKNITVNLGFTNVIPSNA
jgi:hypothetical protein